MLITKFNRMIRNRFVWAVFALIVSVFFVLSAASIRSCGRQEQASGMGMLYGEPVSAREFALARMFELGFRERGDISNEGEKRLRDRVWKRLAALRTAERMGLSVADEEVATALQKDPTFAPNGVFDRTRYEAIVRNQLGADTIIFEDYVRQEILLRKLAGAFDACVWTPPTEVDDRARNLTDTFEVEYVNLDEEALVPAVTVTEEQARAIFEENKATFMVPPQVSVRYVTFPFSNYLASVEVPEDEITDYYEDHRSEFVPADSTNATAEPLPIDAVRDQIVTALRQREASFKARDVADEFTINMVPPPYGKGQPFSAAAAAAGLAIHTTEFFTASGEVPGLKVGREFNEAAFDLDAEGEQDFSDAILGEDAAYVLSRGENREAHIPAFEAVKDEAMDLARRTVKNEEFSKKSAEIRQSIRAGLDAGNTFRKAAESLSLNVSTTGQFSAYESMTGQFNERDAIVPTVMNMQGGELSDVLPGTTNALVLYVSSRGPGDPLSSQFLKPQLLSTLDRYRSGVVFESWLDWVLVQSGFKDNQPVTATNEEEDDE